MRLLLERTEVATNDAEGAIVDCTFKTVFIVDLHWKKDQKSQQFDKSRTESCRVDS